MKIKKYHLVEDFDGTPDEWRSLFSETDHRPSDSHQAVTGTSNAPVGPDLAWVRKLWSQTDSENQETVITTIVRAGGMISASDLTSRTGLEGQSLRGVLSCVTRNAQRITGDPDARLIDFAKLRDGIFGYQIEPGPLSALQELIEAQS
jgi:hypothetical protein